MPLFLSCADILSWAHHATSNYKGSAITGSELIHNGGNTCLIQSLTILLYWKKFLFAVNSRTKHFVTVENRRL